jgi:hypothetical protein
MISPDGLFWSLLAVELTAITVLVLFILYWTQRENR